MGPSRSSGAEAGLRGDILRRHGRRQSTAAVVFNHALAERLGLGPSDLKCLDLLLERGPMTGSELVAITGLTSGAVTGVAARLERAGFLRRTPDPGDGRKQILVPTADRVEEIDELFAPMHDELARLLEVFDAHQLAAIAEFMDRSTDCVLRHAALLRAHARVSTVPTRSGTPSTPGVAPAQHGAMP